LPLGFCCLAAGFFSRAGFDFGFSAFGAGLRDRAEVSADFSGISALVASP
jgi:hypothetical protein